MDFEDLLVLLSRWLAGQPTARGHGIEDAEIRLRTSGEGRLAEWLRPKNPEAELRAVGLYLVDKLEEVGARDVGEVGEPSTPPDFPQRAFADFTDLEDLARILEGRKNPQFYFDDEVEETGDPLRDW